MIKTHPPIVQRLERHRCAAEARGDSSANAALSQILQQLLALKFWVEDGLPKLRGTDAALARAIQDYFGLRPPGC